MATGGQIKSDREYSTLLRRLTLKQSIKVMSSEPTDAEEKKFKQALHLKLAANVLPRIQEHMGEDGGAIIVMTSQEAADKYKLYESKSITSTDTQGQA